MTKIRHGFPWLAPRSARRRCDVGAPRESSAEAVTRLRDCLNDLVSITLCLSCRRAGSRVRL